MRKQALRDAVAVFAAFCPPVARFVVIHRRNLGIEPPDFGVGAVVAAVDGFAVPAKRLFTRASVAVMAGERCYCLLVAQVGRRLPPFQRRFFATRHAFAAQVASAEFVLGARVAAHRRFFQPFGGKRALAVAADAQFALLVKAAENVHRVAIALRCGFFLPVARDVGVLWHAFAVAVEVGEVVLRKGKALFGRRFVPFGGSRVVLRDAVPFVVERAEVVLRGCIALCRRFSPPVTRCHIVHRACLAFVPGAAEVVLGGGIARYCPRAQGLHGAARQAGLHCFCRLRLGKRDIGQQEQ